MNRTDPPTPRVLAVPGAWYREPWPWILFGIPAATVIAGVATITVAFSTFDGVVADDYYRQGLAINRTMARDARAQAMGLAARVQFSPDGTRVRIALAGPAGVSQGLRLRLVHPSRGGGDQVIGLAEVAPGLHEGSLPRAPAPGRWRLHVEDLGEEWRLVGSAYLPAPQAVELRAGNEGEEGAR
ncbi:MAG: FixH family protein [Pseudomonadota bacterium]|jgi:hypothetical protein